MRARRTQLEIFSPSFLDCICCGLGAVLIVLLMYVHEMRSRENTVPALQARITALSNDVINLNTRVAILSHELGNQTNTILALSNAWMGLVVQCAHVSDELKLAKDKLRIIGDMGGTVQQQLNLIQILSNELQTAQNARTIMGMPISQRRLVFLIDTSLSMADDQRLADVKGAFKVMLASLHDAYQIDLISYTTAGSQDRTLVYRPLWGSLRQISDATRQNATRFVTELMPQGGTPTTTATVRALRAYPDATAIVLLSDGEPTDHDVWTRCADDIRAANSRHVPIYTVGVGSSMSDTGSAGRQFMERVASESGAKCISF